jgi:uncharacterized protein YcbK (DUF882 family)
LKYPTASLSIGLTFGLAIGLLASIVAIPAGPALSSEPTKTLKLAFGHTGETGTFTFKRNGVYDQGELKRLSHFLRDWRKDESTRMDPHLLDLVWAIYQKSGSHDAIHVVSAYRSPSTNEMLRSRAGSGVAKHSQHRLGKAMDWYLTDVPLPKLRAAAMQMQGGGVGYYPRSGSPFVHTDTGNVRAWPRMSRQQLIALFPNGNTLHLPADGKPLPGYEQAVARRHTTSGGTALAYLDSGSGEGDETDRTGTDSSSSWLKRVFPGKRQSEDVAAVTPTAATAPATIPASEAPQTVATADEDITADMPRQPRARPDIAAGGETVLASLETSDDTVSTPLPKSRPNQGEDTAATAVDDEDAIASLAERMNQDYPDSTAEAADPVALTFAAASDAPQPAEADRAILAAFATLADSDAIRPPDPNLTAALTHLAAEENAQQQQPAEQPAVIAASYDGSDLLLRPGEPEPQVTGAIAEPAAAVAQSAPVVVAPEPEVAVAAEPQPENIGQPEPAIVLASVEAPSYGGDEHILVNLIETPAETPASNAGEFAMPTPASGLLVAPGGASEVTDLRGRSGPPVERFTRNGGTQPEEGFLSRLFASLVE